MLRMAERRTRSLWPGPQPRLPTSIRPLPVDVVALPRPLAKTLGKSPAPSSDVLAAHWRPAGTSSPYCVLSSLPRRPHCSHAPGLRAQSGWTQALTAC